MPKNDHEVLEYFIADSQTEYLDYVAYAIYIHDKHSWLDHVTRLHGRPATDAEIETWISNLTDQQLARFIDTASELFDDAARTYLKDELASTQDNDFKRKLLDAMSFRRQFGLAILASVLTPLILGLLLAALLSYEKWPSILRVF